MAGKGLQDEQVKSPSGPSLLSPLGFKPRRNSTTSVDSQMDKDTVAQALDQIHSSASRSESLTTFNDFTSPPLSTSEHDDKSSAIQAPVSSLGNIYSRLKASVSAPKEPPPSQPSSSKGTGKGNEIPVKASNLKPSPVSTKDAEKTSAAPPISTAPATPKTPQSSKSPAGEELVKPLSSNLTDSAKATGKDMPRPASQSSIIQPEPSTLHERKSSHISNEFSYSARLKPLSTPGSILGEGESNALLGDIGHQFTSGPSSDPGLRPDGSSLKDEPYQLISPTLRDDRSISKSSEPTKSPLPHSPASSARSAPSQRNSHADLSALQMRNPDRPSLLEKSRIEPELTTSAVLSNEMRSHAGIPAPRSRPAGQLLHSNSAVYQMQRKVLSRDFWMKDENAKVCFNCGESFSTFRRKHHCRLCGQIYCNSCTNLISGKPFGQASKLRACRTCEAMLNDDDSSDFSEDEESAPVTVTKQIRFSDSIKKGLPSPSSNVRERHDEEKSSNPLGGTLSSRRSRELKRSLTSGMEPSRQPVLPRPSSSRSLKSLANRPRSSSHKSHRTRNHHMRSLSFLSNDAPPFHRASHGNDKTERSLPAFHTDSIIDPDLAPFMSDEGSSEEDFPSLSAALDQETHEQTAQSFNSGLGALRRGRPRTSTKSIAEPSAAARDTDNASVATSRAGHHRRLLGNRTFSMGSIVNHTSSPRVIRSDNLLRSSDNLYAMLNRFNTPERGNKYKQEAFAPWDVSDNKDTSEPGVAELNPASLLHVKNLLGQFLRDTNIHHTKRWERALVPILLRCAEELDPSIHRGDDIDIRHYVKLKKAPGGSPGDSRYISGVVFSKNVALKDMARTIHSPRILLVSFPLIYARHQQHFMSLEGVMAQEREYLKNLSNRIIALKPNLVLVDGQVAGLVTGFLRDAGITVIYNVKSSVMYAASRCTQTRIVSSVDKLTMDPRGLGHCERFDVKTHVYQESKISHVYLSGCQKDLGCTIVLRGADRKTLSKLKWITEFMCYVTYNLKLETCLMRDQFVSLPSTREHIATPATATNSRRLSTPDAAASVDSENLLADQVDDGNTPFEEKINNPATSKQNPGNGREISETEKPESFGSYDSTVKQLRQRLLSASPFVALAEPYLLLRGQEQEIHMARLRALQNAQSTEVPETASDDEKQDIQKFELVRPEMIYAKEQNASRHVREILHAVHTAEYEKASHNYSAIQRRWEAYVAGVVEPYSPLTHQRIVVLFSTISTPSSDACEGPDLLGLDFYQEHDIDEGCEQDMPLGEFIERICDQVDSPCIANHCDRKMIEHQRQYVHGDGQISLSVEKYTSRYRGMENTILMWSCCRKCEQETQVVPMSGDSWKYSFAKYLELSFWSGTLHPRAGTCPHDIHRDHFRYFGFKNLAVRVQYDPINIVEITVPRGTITWAVDKDLRLKNDQYQNIEGRIGRFLSSVRLRLKNIKLSSIEAEKREACKAEVENLLKRVNGQYDTLAVGLQEQYTNSRFYETIPLNRALRRLQEEVAQWDSTFADFEKNYFPSEKDLQKLAATQLRKAYFDQEDPIPVTLDDENSLNEKIDAANYELDKEGDPIAPQAHQTQASLDLQGQHALTSERPRTADADTHPTAIMNPEAAQLVQKLDLAIPESVAEVSQPRLSKPMQDDDVFASTSDRDSGLQARAALDNTARLKINPAAQNLGKGYDEEPQQSEASDVTTAMGHQDGKPPIPPPLVRSQTSPSGTAKLLSAESVTPLEGTSGPRRTDLTPTSSKIPLPRPSKSPEKSNSSAIKLSKSAMSSMIPRAIGGRRIETKVSALAKHFEQMSREFEKERLRERLQRAARTRQARAFPLASAQPILEVFRDASEAVREREPSYEDLGDSSLTATSQETSSQDLQKIQDDTSMEKAQLSDHEAHVDHVKSAADNSEENTIVASYPPSEFEVTMSDTDASSIAPGAILADGADSRVTSSTGAPEYPIEIPKEEKSSLMKMLTSFWSERSASGWAALEYPLLPTAHIFADSDLIVREDEPSSLIALTLASQDYKNKIRGFWEKAKAAEKDKSMPNIDMSASGEDTDVEKILLGTTATHMRYQFQTGTSRMQCKVFYAESFDAIRRKCGVSDRFVESLSRCLKWDSKGGKTKSVFLKTLDERFVLKSLSPVETQAFLKFAPDYFDYMSKCLFHNLPSALAKMLGFYQVVIKNPATGVEFNWFLQVMENVFYEGPSNRMFDLKGSMRNRKVQSTGDKDEVLLDENLLDYISQSPVYVRNHSNTVLASSIQNDTLFCSKQNVMDYSLIVGLYDDRKELLVGIIDYIRTYTWDKKLESWIKDRGKHRATVRSPKEYRARFRRSIPRYFPLAPSCWQIFGMRRLEDARARQEELDMEELDEEEAHAEGVGDSEDA